MRIQNTSSASVSIPLTITKADGTAVNISLGSGEFFYTDSDAQTKSVIIQVKKGNVKTFDEGKPDALGYFQVYQEGTQPSGIQTIRTPKQVDPLDKYRGKFRIPETTRPFIPPVQQIVPEEKTIIEKWEDSELLKDLKSENLNPDITKIFESNPVQIINEEPKAKNKGGRPKGSKDTIKRGTPKLKKLAGRPINPELLKGMSVEEVKAKCEPRGYSIRITNEDGNSFAVTFDMDFTRINLHIEKGIVVKASIG